MIGGFLYKSLPIFDFITSGCFSFIVPLLPHIQIFGNEEIALTPSVAIFDLIFFQKPHVIFKLKIKVLFRNL